MSTDELTRIRAAHDRYATDRRQRRRRDARNRGLMLLMREWHDAVVSELRTRDLLRPTTRILDVGCGDGWLLARLAAEGVAPEHLHGIDLMPERVRAARVKAPGARIEEGSATALPGADGSFDVVCLAMVLSSILDPAVRAQVAAECRRVLAPGGVIACYELRVASPRNRDVEALPSAVAGMLFPGMERTARTLSLLPPVARHLGLSARWLYGPLARLPALHARHLTILSNP